MKISKVKGACGYLILMYMTGQLAILPSSTWIRAIGISLFGTLCYILGTAEIVEDDKDA